MSYKDKEWLFNKYIVEKKSQRTIGKICNVSYNTIRYYLKKFNIEIRNHEESMKIRKKGYKLSEKTKKKMSLAHSGSKHYNWKGDKAKKKAIHMYLNKCNKNPKVCEQCGKDSGCRIELSFDHSLGNHTRNIEDYMWLCHSCHLKRDYKYGLR